MAKRDLQHLLGRRHLEVERQVDLGHQAVDIAVGDVAPVLAQMRSDSIGSRRRGAFRCTYRVGMVPAARVPDRRDMVDIDAQAGAICSSGRAAPGLHRRNGRELWRHGPRLIGRHVDADERKKGTPRSAEPLDRSTSAAAATTSPPAAATASIASRDEGRW